MTPTSLEPLTGLRASLYEAIRPFEPQDGSMRIFAPASYSLVRHAQLVPVVHIEAFSLAHWFPLCWLKRDGCTTLVTLRTLRSDGSGQPAGSPDTAASLPLALRAYPFVVGAGGGDRHFLDAAIPDQPSDVGAPIMTQAGKAGPGAQLKMQALAAFDHALAVSQAMTDTLVESDLLEAWPLDFDVDGERVVVDDMFVLKASELTSVRMFQFIEKYGSAAAAFLGAHRISLFRAGSLVQAARRTAPAAIAAQ